MATGPSAHAALGPSSAHRWMACPGAPAAEREARSRGLVDDSSSPAAREGTAAHAVAELELRRRVLDEPVAAEVAGWHETYDVDYEWQVMVTETRPYVDYVEACYLAALEVDPAGAQLWLESRVEPVPGRVWGTADATIIGDGRVHVVDLKYGRGVRVEAIGNPQLRCYMLGALDVASMLEPVAECVGTIVQPRHKDGGHISSEALLTEELQAWGARLLEAVAATDAPDAPRVPGDSQCRWCAAQAICPERTRSLAADVFGEARQATVPLLSDAEVAELLPRLDSVESWCRAVRRSALSRLTQRPGSLAGWHVAEGRPRRRVTEAVVDRLAADTGRPRSDFVEERLLSVRGLERLVGRERVADVAPLFDVSVGPPRLVQGDADHA
nr:MAG TPA: Protein of unknown function (DUF2800) [Caudoviricetes sp.]